MTQWDGSWADDGGIADQYEADISLYDPNLDPVLQLRWDGFYRGRFLPTRSRQDFNVPYGQHFNVFPVPENQKISVVSCPRFTSGGKLNCPICDGISKAVVERRIVWDDVSGEQGIVVQRSVLNRFLLLDFEAFPGQKKVPKFTNYPLLKILKSPAASVGKELAEKLDDHRDFGWKAIFDPVKGRVIKINRNKKNKPNMYKVDFLDAWEIPEEFLDVETWPDFYIGLPMHTPEELVEMVKLSAGNVPDFIENYVMAIDTVTSKPRIDAGESQQSNGGTKKSSMLDKAKEALNKI